MNSKAPRKSIYLPDLVGKGYAEFWNFKGRYRVVKGSRASKKSKTAALWFIFSLMKYPKANLLVVRKTYRTLKDSCFTELKWAINRLGVSHLWESRENPLELRYRTGQKIYFRGLDDPLKITSISVETGFLCWLYLEEAYEVTKEDDFNLLNESIRGALPEDSGLFKQITLILNPWNEKHWIRRRFFGEIIGRDAENQPIYRYYDNYRSADGQILALTTDYTCNEWLDKADLKLFEDMKVQNPKRFKVAGLGHWGAVEGLVYTNWVERSFELERIKALSGVIAVFGLDFGYTNSPSALCCSLINLKAKKLWVFDEMYEKGLSNERIAAKILEMGYSKEEIAADAAEPKSIDRLKELGLSGVRAALKGKDSVNAGIDFLQDFEIIVHPRCVNFLTEISNYSWEVDKTGALINKPIKDFDHCLDALRYSIGKFIGHFGSYKINFKTNRKDSYWR